jgi:death-on-curing protein
MREFVWVPLRAVVAIQGELIAEHGGLSGPPRFGQLESALTRPQQVLAYAQTPPPLARLAAVLCHGLARGHCFPDGNKRVALAILDVFLQMNGSELQAPELEAVETIQSLAAGDLSEEDLEVWIAAHAVPSPSSTR